MSTKELDEKNTFAELERIEDKYIIDMSDFSAIHKEIEKHLNPAYLNNKTKYVLISTTYLDSANREFFRSHVSFNEKRLKVRYRQYAPNGSWDNPVFLELKEKDYEDVHKSRIQLDDANFKNIDNGKLLKFTDELEKLNTPLYTHMDLKRFISRYNKIAESKKIAPVLNVEYKRLAFGKGTLRVTMDTNLTYHPIKPLPLSQATNIRKAVDWKVVKQYHEKYDPETKAILEIKHESDTLPKWLTDLLNKYKLEPMKFSKYVWASYDNINLMKGFGK